MSETLEYSLELYKAEEMVAFEVGKFQAHNSNVEFFQGYRQEIQLILHHNLHIPCLKTFQHLHKVLKPYYLSCQAAFSSVQKRKTYFTATNGKEIFISINLLSC